MGNYVIKKGDYKYQIIKIEFYLYMEKPLGYGFS